MYIICHLSFIHLYTYIYIYIYIYIMFLYYIFIHFPIDNFKVKFTLALMKEVFSF